jgi:hypothetical protein
MFDQPPMKTVGAPVMITPPCIVLSPMRAAGSPHIITLPEPVAMLSTGPTQVAVSVTRAAGIPQARTVGAPVMIGPPTCGTIAVVCGQVC